MNINSNELLLMKKIKFAGVNDANNETENESNSLVTNPADSSIQTGLNALMFKGMMNLMDEPQLATSAEFLKETVNSEDAEVKEEKDGEEYVAPYKSNLAFQGKMDLQKFKTLALAGTVAASSIMGPASLTSCKSEFEAPDVYVTVNIDISGVIMALQSLQGSIDDMKEWQKLSYEQQQATMLVLQQMLSELTSTRQLTEQFYKYFQTFVSISSENQEMIISLLEKQGISSDKANAMMAELLDLIKRGDIEGINKKIDEIMKLLSDIKQLLSQAISDFNEYRTEMVAAQNELKNKLNEIIKNQNYSNSKLDEVTNNQKEIIQLQYKQIEAQNTVKEAIINVNLDSNANFEKVISTLNIGKSELISMLMKMGYTQAQILQMTASDIINAIDNNTKVTVATNQMLSIVVEYVKLLPEMLKQGKITNAQFQKLNASIQDLINKVESGNITLEQFRREAIDLLLTSTENQQLILQKLQENGKTEKEAKAILERLLREFRSESRDFESILQEIYNILGDIKGMLSEAITDFKNYFEKMIAAQKDLTRAVNRGFDELIKNSKITNATLNDINNNTNALLESSEKQNEAQQQILAAIQQANLDSNANFETVVATLNINKDELIAVLMKMGYTQAQISGMNTAQIVAAINHNTYVTEKGNAMLNQITKYMAILPELYKNSKITNAQLQEFYALFKEAMAANGEYSDEMLAKLEQLLNKLESIESTLNNIASDFHSFYNDYKKDRRILFGYLDQVVKNGKFQTAVILNMAKTQQQMAANLSNLEANSNELLNIINDPDRYNQFIEDIKNANATSGMSKEDLEEMFKALGITITQAINMSSAQLQQAIKNFQNTYIKTEKAQTKQLESINAKLSHIQYWQGLNTKMLVDAINGLTTAVNQEGTDITLALNAVEAQLQELQKTVNNLLDAFLKHAKQTEDQFKKWNVKFSELLKSVKNIDRNVASLKAALQTSNTYLNQVATDIAELKADIKNIQTQGGKDFDYDRLESFLKERDEANFAAYKEFILSLHIDTSKLNSIEDLLISIDNKLDGIKQDTSLLAQILNKLDGINLTNEQLSAIRELLENFECNCTCNGGAGNNEGILGNLDNILR